MGARSDTAISGTLCGLAVIRRIMALAAQKAAARLGNANPELHHLAAAQANGGPAVFHGDHLRQQQRVPGVTGFNAAAGYDQTTGWGSVDADKLVTAWGSEPCNLPPTLGLRLFSSASRHTLAKTGTTINCDDVSMAAD